MGSQLSLAAALLLEARRVGRAPLKKSLSCRKAAQRVGGLGARLRQLRRPCASTRRRRTRPPRLRRRIGKDGQPGFENREKATPAKTVCRKSGGREKGLRLLFVNVSQGVVTAPLLLAAQEHPEELLPLLARRLRGPRDASLALEKIRASAALPRSRLLIRLYAQHALRLIQRLPLQSEAQARARSELAALTLAVVTRASLK